MRDYSLQENDERENFWYLSNFSRVDSENPTKFMNLRCRWFCHFDDDNFVNVPALLRKLRQFDHREDWYLGKPSIPEPLEILDRDNMQVNLALANC